MRDWNVAVSVHENRFTRACQLLQRYGQVGQTKYYNVLVMKVEEPVAFAKTLAALVSTVPEVLEVVSRVVPATIVFDFEDASEFETRAREAALTWLADLAGRSFHVRLHRRGHRQELPSQEEERKLDGILLEALERAGTPGRIDFEDPDAILAIETVGDRAGLSLWTREDLRRYPFLRLD
jgi:tRNA(Ser,Leu) C12 N-acetylase TAN1